MLTILAEALVSFFLVVATVFALLGAVGLVRFPDFFTRLHAPTKASTLGVGGALLASMIHFAAAGSFGLRELAITLFIFVTAPVSANLLAKAALHRRGLPDGSAAIRSQEGASLHADDRRQDDAREDRATDPTRRA